MKNKNNKVGYLLYGTAIFILIAGFAIFVLEKQQVTDFYSKSLVVTDGSRPVNDVRYTPSDPTDNDSINEQKESGAINEQPTTPEQGAPVSIVLTAAGQDDPGGPVVVKVLLTDLTTGECTINMSKDEITKEYTSSVTNAGTYYNCNNTDIPLSDLSAGTWLLTATVSSNGRIGSVNKIVEVNK